MRAWLFVVAAGCSFQPTGAHDAPGAPRDAAADAAPDATPDAALVNAGSAWWNTAWAERLPIAITNGSSAPLPYGYQIALAFDVASMGCQSNPATPDDIRIVYGNTSDRPRAIDTVGPPEWIWFSLVAPLAAGATSTGDYWLYCHNPAATPPTTGSAEVFEIYDGFDGTLDTTRWNPSSPTNVTVSDGQLKCASGVNGNTGVATRALVPYESHAIDFAASAPTSDTFWWGGFQAGFSDAQPWVLWYRNPAKSGAAPSTAAPDPATILFGNPVGVDANEHIYGLENDNGTASFRYEDVPVGILADVGDGSAYNVRLWNGGSNETIDFDWVRVRQSVYPSPIVTLGAVQTQ